MVTMYFKNWKCGSYRLTYMYKKDYSYNELKEYFVIDGSEVVYCKKDFGQFQAGKYYLVEDGKWYGTAFHIMLWHSYDSWAGKEYMKEDN